MAKLSIASFNSLTGGVPQMTTGQPDCSVLDFSFGAQETDIFSSNGIRFARICADAPCFYETGTTPVVGASSRYLPANTIEVLSLDPNTRIRVAAAAE